MKFAYLIEPPFNYVDPQGHLTGCDVELARHVFETLGNVKFEPVETEFAELLPGLQDGRWRMTTGLFGTKERRTLAQFSHPIWTLSDGLLVQKGNPLGLTGYRSVAASPDARLAVIRDQFQHQSASACGIPDDRITIFETYMEAACAVRAGHVDAYASVGRAHSGFIAQQEDQALELVSVPSEEIPAAFGSFALSLNDTALRTEINEILLAFLGTDAHRKMVAPFGFSSEDVDRVIQHSDGGRC